MSDDGLESILRLVADGHLTADEAGPILDALDAASGDRSQAADPGPADASAASPARGSGRTIRLEVTEKGRKIVNLRVPVSLGRAALMRVPGLSDATTDSIREAIEGGMTGPIVAVDDGSGDGVRIVIE